MQLGFSRRNIASTARQKSPRRRLPRRRLTFDWLEQRDLLSAVSVADAGMNEIRECLHRPRQLTRASAEL